MIKDKTHEAIYQNGLIMIAIPYLRGVWKMKFINRKIRFVS